MEFIKKEGARILGGYGMSQETADTYIIDAINQFKRGQLSTGAKLFAFFEKAGKAHAAGVKKREREERRRFN